MKISAGYIQIPHKVTFVDGEWLFNNSPVDNQVCLSLYPCYDIKNSELGNLVVVIGDSDYNYADEAIQRASGISYSYLSDNPDILKSVWLLEYADAYYIAISINGDKPLTSCVPLAINAEQLYSNMQELHLYLDTGSSDCDIVTCNLAIFASDIDETLVHFYTSEQQCSEVATVFAKFVLNSAVLTSVEPNITGYDPDKNIQYIEQMGEVDIHLQSSQCTGADIVGLCKSAYDGYCECAVATHPNWYLPKYNQPPKAINPDILAAGASNASRYISGTVPYELSILSRLNIDFEDEEYDDEEDVSDDYAVRDCLVTCLLLSSQCCSYTASAPTAEILHVLLADTTKATLDALVKAMSYDFLFPDAIAFYLKSGFILDDSALKYSEAIINGDFCEPAFMLVSEYFNSPYSYAFARQLLDKKKVFKRGRATLSSDYPYGVYQEGNNLVIMALASRGYYKESYLKPETRYSLQEMLLEGSYLPYFTLLWGLYTLSYRTRTREVCDHRALAGKYIDNLVLQSKSDKDNGLPYLRLSSRFGYSPGNVSVAAITSSCTFNSTATGFDSLRKFSPTFKYPCAAGDWGINIWQAIVNMLTIAGLGNLALSIPRNLRGFLAMLNNSSDTSEMKQCEELTITYASFYCLTTLWLRCVQGTISEGKDPVCVFDPTIADMQTEQDFEQKFAVAISSPRNNYKLSVAMKDKDLSSIPEAELVADILSDGRVPDYPVLYLMLVHKSDYSAESLRLIRGDTQGILSNKNDRMAMRKKNTDVVCSAMRLNKKINDCYTKNTDILCVPAFYDVDTCFSSDDHGYFFSSATAQCVTISLLTSKRVNALLTLSNKHDSNSFYSEYLTCLTSMCDFWIPVLQDTSSKSVTLKLQAFCGLIQSNLQSYSLSELNRVLNDDSIKSSLESYCLSHGYTSTDLAEIFDTSVQPDEDSDNTPIQHGNLEGSLSESEIFDLLSKLGESLDDDTPIQADTPVTSVTQFVDRSYIGLQELQPRAFKLNSDSNTGLASLNNDNDIVEGTAPDESSEMLEDISEADSLLAQLEAMANEYDSSSDNSNAVSSVQANSISDFEDNRTDTVAQLGTLEDDIETRNPQSSVSKLAETMMTQFDTDVKMLFNIAVPESSASMVALLRSKRTCLAIKGLLIVPETEELALIHNIGNSVDDLYAYCVEHKANCYFDATDLLCIREGELIYHVYKLQGQLRKVQSELASGLFNMQRYATLESLKWSNMMV